MKIATDDSRVQRIVKIHTHKAVNTNKLAHDKILMQHLTAHQYQYIAVSDLEKEEKVIDKLQTDLSNFLSLDVKDLESYKKEFKALVYDKRLHYRNITTAKSYDTARRWWREEKYHLITVTFLQAEKEAYEKLYKELFPSLTRKYSAMLHFFPNQPPVQVSVEAVNKEEALILFKKNFPNAELYIKDLKENITTYYRKEQDDFPYAEE